MVKIDSKKVDAMMTMISMSLMWAMPSNIPIDKDFKDNNRKEDLFDKELKALKNRKRKPVSIKTFGKIKKSSVNKVNELIDTYLDKSNSVDTVVIAVGSNIEEFGKERLNVDFKQIKEGEKIKGMGGIQIFIAENEIDTLLPSVLMTLNEYLGTHK